MNRIKQTFARLKQTCKAALIPYIAAGDPKLEYTVPLLHAMVSAGADIIELGVPFSDPVADGPTIQAAHERALKQGVTLHHVLEQVAEFRRKDTHTPIVLMTYANPIEIMGYDEFIEKALAVDIDGLLVVDMPPEEGKAWFTQLKDVGIDPILLVAPNTSQQRIKMIAELGSGYLYYVSMIGVTGSNTLDVGVVREKINTLKNLTALPISSGFGIRDAQSAAHLAEVADGIIIGSALIEQLASSVTLEAALKNITQFICNIRSTIDSKKI